MKSMLMVFRDEMGDEVRGRLNDKGEPCVMLADACRGLNIQNSRDAASRLDDDEKCLLRVGTTDMNRGKRLAMFVNESGLYALIFQSRKPEAKQFRKWITSEVLPAIRKTGQYGVDVKYPIESNPFFDRIRANEHTLPKGYFSVFTELTFHVPRLMALGLKIDEHTVPDISVGTAWSRYWQAKDLDAPFGPRCLYAHYYPRDYAQARANPHRAYCYPDMAAGPFRSWFREEYCRNGLSQYLLTKNSKGELTSEVTRSILTVFQPTAIGAPQ